MSTSPCNSRISATDPVHHAVLTPSQMARADQLSIQGGTPGFQLMQAAGQAVVDAMVQRWAPQPVHILCGPGNNGGDGFVIARLLQERRWPVRLALLGRVDEMRGDARAHAAQWTGTVDVATSAFLDGASLVVDALFGTGLARPLDGMALHLVQAIRRSGVPVCAVDIPSGVDGNTGQIRGDAVQATLTVTFCRKKLGQLLLPGRLHCGELVVADIGISDATIQELDVVVHENHPDLWRQAFPRADSNHHKYMRGHVLVRGGDVMTGAARLAAQAAARAGAGLVSVAASSSSWPIYAAALTSVMVRPCDGLQAWRALLTEARHNVVLIGPGVGAADTLQDEVLTALDGSRTVVLDADALTAFASAPDTLFNAISGPCVMTPHTGEFARLFGTPDGQTGKLEQARSAARRSGAVVVLKGADTVIAAPDGRAVINSNAPPQLATGGSGDVLAGIIAGLLAQGMDMFSAASAAVWLHGRAASLFGPGLIADDLPGMLVQALHELSHGERNDVRG